MEQEKQYTIFVSEKAQEAIKKQLEKRNTPGSFIRLGVKGSGCSGYEYVIQFEDSNPRDKDLVFDFGGLKVVIDPKSIIYLNGTTLDWENGLMERGFKFVNPNSKGSCGCGKSFST